MVVVAVIVVVVVVMVVVVVVVGSIFNDERINRKNEHEIKYNATFNGAVKVKQHNRLARPFIFYFHLRKDSY